MLTKQSEKDSTDVNLIMDSWVHVGAAVAGHMNPAEGAYGDFSSGIDYHAAVDAVKESERVFAALDPKIRDHVDNDPGKLLDMVFDPERRDELVELGLVAPAEKVKEPEVTEVKAKEPVVPSVEPEEGLSDPAAELFD